MRYKTFRGKKTVYLGGVIGMRATFKVEDRTGGYLSFSPFPATTKFCCVVTSNGKTGKASEREGEEITTAGEVSVAPKRDGTALVELRELSFHL